MSATGMQMGLPRGAYFERPEPAGGWLDVIAGRLGRVRATRRRRVRRRREAFLAKIESLSLESKALSEERLVGWVTGLGLVLRRSDFASDPVARVFALLSELSERSLLGRPGETDLWAARLMLEGSVVEMPAGSTALATTLAAITAALTGMPVHVVHGDDEAAGRLLAELRVLHDKLGLRVGQATAGAAAKERLEAYACEITYCNHKQLAFDYLRDRILLGQDAERGRLLIERLHAPQPRLQQVLLRGLGFALVEDAVSLLIDAARVPLVIGDRTGAAEEEREVQRARELAGSLKRDVHYTVDTFEQDVLLTPRGRLRIQEETRSHGGAWESPVRREELVRLALFADELARRGRDYVVDGERVEPRDDVEAAWLHDGTWERGLGRAVEVKEGCPLSVHTEPRGRLSYQRLFRRYARVAGTAPAVLEAKAELGEIYGLSVVDLELPAARQELPPVLHASAERRWTALGQRIATLQREGRTALVFVTDEEAARRLGSELEEAGLTPTLVTETGEEAEAAYARSREPGRITVAVASAVRRAPFHPEHEDDVAAELHVILAQRHGARHAERELAARGGTGERPGSFELWGSLEDPFFVEHGASWLKRLAMSRVGPDDLVPARLASLLVREMQRSCERKDRNARRDLMALDDYYTARLAFAGGSDT